MKLVDCDCGSEARITDSGRCGFVRGAAFAVLALVGAALVFDAPLALAVDAKQAAKERRKFDEMPQLPAELKQREDGKDARDIAAGDEASMDCLLVRTQCQEQCQKRFAEIADDGKGYIMEDPKKKTGERYQLAVYMKRRCLLSCDWNRDMCLGQ